MSKSQPMWQRYERLIAKLMADQISTDLCATPNARIIGRISGKRRQIDVLIDARHDTDNSRRIIVDAKMRSRKIDVVQVEAFRGLMDDVDATHGYLVCPVGHTAAAQKRAQESVRICLVPLEHLNGYDPANWPRCRCDECARGRVFWDGFPVLSLDLAPLERVHEYQRLEFVHHVGKCDECGRFHVKCLTCGELFSLEDNEGDHRCACRLPWYWIASVEKDNQGTPSAELHVVMGTGQVITVDRRPM